MDPYLTDSLDDKAEFLSFMSKIGVMVPEMASSEGWDQGANATRHSLTEPDPDPNLH